MSVTLYDEAILTKFKNWVRDPGITILGVNDSTNLFKYKLDTTDDQPLQLPLISLSRGDTINIVSTGKQPRTFDGIKHDVAEDYNKNLHTGQLNYIDIIIPYQLDIYTRYEDEAQEYLRNFIFNIINYPRFNIEIPYNNSKICMNGYIQLGNDIVDNSDVPEHLIRDQFRRKTLSLTVQGKLYDYKIYDNCKIDCSQMVVQLLPEEIETFDSIEDENLRRDINDNN